MILVNFYQTLRFRRYLSNACPIRMRITINSSRVQGLYGRKDACDFNPMNLMLSRIVNHFFS